MDSINIDDLGSSSMKLSWSGTSDGTKPIYTIDIMNSNQNKNLKFETNETSLSVEDLDPSTTYILKLSKPMTGILPYISNIRIEHPNKSYLALNEILVFDINGRHMDSSEFVLTSSSLHSSRYAPLARSMDRKTYVTNSWKQSCLLAKGGNSWWNGGLIEPTQLKNIEIHTTSTHMFHSNSSLVLTTPSGVVFTYGLGGDSRGDYRVSTHVKHQKIPMSLLPIGHFDTKKPPPPIGITRIKFVHSNNSWAGFVELQIMDRFNRKMKAGEFRITTSGTHNKGPISKLMDGKGNPGSSWSTGTMLQKSSRGSWLDLEFLKPTPLSSVRIYTTPCCGFNPKYSRMFITTIQRKRKMYELGDKYRTNNINHEFIPIKL